MASPRIFFFMFTSILAAVVGQEPDPGPDCMSPLSRGSCAVANILVYGYKYSAQKCQPFYYSGCGGNNNRYDTLQQCIETCEW